MTNWKHQLNIAHIFHNDDLTIAERASNISLTIKSRPWYDDVNYNGELEDLLDELTDAGKEDNIPMFDAVWDAIYDIFNAHKVWVTAQ